jgi:FkbM family methyltransferase
MKQLFELACAKLLLKKSSPFFVQIGAMDGVMVDPLHKIVKRHRWPGLLLEPIPWHFNSLKNNYRGHDNLIFENVAIAESAGNREMYTVTPESILRFNLPKWALGISSLFPDRNAIGGVECPVRSYKAIQPHVVRQIVSCCTLQEVLDRHHIDRIDLLQIDTEGADYQILNQLNFSRYRPSVIHIEFALLPPPEQKACLALLKEHSYICYHEPRDLLATDEALEKVEKLT